MAANQGLFELNSLKWCYKGRIAETSDLEVARIAEKELLRLGYELQFVFSTARGVFDFHYIKLGRKHDVTLRYLSEESDTEPHWELATMNNKLFCLVRIGKTFKTEREAVNRCVIERRTIHGEIHVRPTLNF